MNILGLIPARGGSKGLPGKNIRPLAGKPLIAWTIEQALASAYLDAIVVSTNDPAIAEVSRSFGAEVPFARPEEISGDQARRIDAVFHALDWLAGQGREFDAVLLLQPTSPLRRTEDIDGAIEFMESRGASAVLSVCRDPHPPYWSGLLPEDRCMKEFLSSSVVGKNRQELGIYYRLTGAIFLAHTEYLRRQGEFLGPRTFAYEMPESRSVDIDTPYDFYIAETLLVRPFEEGHSGE